MNRHLSSEPARATQACHICQEPCDCDRCRLNRAAPELLAALEEVMDHSERAQEQGHYGGLHPHGPILERARAAIRKATGGA
jgi:hypothetical protein